MTTMTGARVLAEMLDGYGTTHVFMVPAVLRRSMANGVRQPFDQLRRMKAAVLGRGGVAVEQETDKF